jgi:hypothetical protein
MDAEEFQKIIESMRCPSSLSAEQFEQILKEELEGYELTDLGWELVTEMLIKQIEENI